MAKSVNSIQINFTTEITSVSKGQETGRSIEPGRSMTFSGHHHCLCFTDDKSNIRLAANTPENRTALEGLGYKNDPNGITYFSQGNRSKSESVNNFLKNEIPMEIAVGKLPPAQTRFPVTEVAANISSASSGGAKTQTAEIKR